MSVSGFQQEQLHTNLYAQGVAARKTTVLLAIPHLALALLNPLAEHLLPLSTLSSYLHVHI